MSRRAVSRCAVTVRCPSSVHLAGLYVGLFPAQLAPLWAAAGAQCRAECVGTGERSRAQDMRHGPLARHTEARVSHTASDAEVRAEMRSFLVVCGRLSEKVDVCFFILHKDVGDMKFSAVSVAYHVLLSR